jgi:flagellin-like protein
MAEKKSCPKCKSKNTYVLVGGKVVCRDCGYDERTAKKSGETKMNKHTNEDAVSPVIGVILMVAITVILAAVIASFVFGMAGQMQKAKSVAATVSQQTADTIVITYQGGQDAVSLETLNCTATQDDGTDITQNVGTVGSQLQVGTSVKLETSGSSFAGKNHVVAVGHFNDGTDQVILDTYV